MSGLGVQHKDWEEVRAMSGKHCLTCEMEPDSHCYFVRSCYYMEPFNPTDVLLSANYGIELVATV